MEKLEEYLDDMYYDIATYAPFYARVLFGLDIVLVKKGEKGPNTKLRTACTDCFKTIWIFEEFLESLTYKQFVFVMLHELGHVIYLTASRRGLREPAKWNVASDYAINWDLHISKVDDPTNHFYYEILQGCLISPKYKGMTAEEIYDLLPDNMDYSDFEDVIPLEGGGIGDDLDMELAGQAMADSIRDAAQKSKDFGNLPGGMERFVEELEKNDVDWKALLQEYVVNFPEDYDYSKMDRRFEDIFVADIGGEKVEIALGLDQSGSISKEVASELVGEIVNLLKVYTTVQIKAFTFDTDIIHAMDINGLEDIPEFIKTLKGGGGTSFKKPIIKAQKRNEISVIIMLTDGYGDFPNPKDVTKPIIWLITEGGKLPDVKHGRSAFIAGSSQA